MRVRNSQVAFTDRLHTYILRWSESCMGKDDPCGQHAPGDHFCRDSGISAVVILICAILGIQYLDQLYRRYNNVTN